LVGLWLGFFVEVRNDFQQLCPKAISSFLLGFFFFVGGGVGALVAFSIPQLVFNDARSFYEIEVFPPLFIFDTRRQPPRAFSVSYTLMEAIALWIRDCTLVSLLPPPC